MYYSEASSGISAGRGLIGLVAAIIVAIIAAKILSPIYESFWDSGQTVAGNIAQWLAAILCILIFFGVLTAFSNNRGDKSDTLISRTGTLTLYYPTGEVQYTLNEADQTYNDGEIVEFVSTNGIKGKIDTTYSLVWETPKKESETKNSKTPTNQPSQKQSIP